jgi:CreA protein
MRRILPVLTATCLALLVLPQPVSAEEVGRVGVDWVGNDIIVEAIADPDVEGVVCHLAYFERSLIDRLSQGNWFEDPSNSAISCTATGPVVIGDIDRSADGERVFRESRSLILKSLSVRRIYDEANGLLIYLVHSSELTEGSAKMSISTVPVNQPAD